MKDSHSASYREILIEHLFTGSIMRSLWLRDITQFEVLKPQVDDSGYDLVLEANGYVRHVQLKSSNTTATSGEVNASVKLESKPSACIIWILVNPENFTLGPFLWYGGAPGQPIPSIGGFRTAKHVRANSNGVKAERPNYRCIPKRRFEPVGCIELLVDRLFGEFESGPA